MKDMYVTNIYIEVSSIPRGLRTPLISGIGSLVRREAWNTAKGGWCSSQVQDKILMCR